MVVHVRTKSNPQTQKNILSNINFQKNATPPVSCSYSFMGGMAPLFSIFGKIKAGSEAGSEATVSVACVFLDFSASIVIHNY